MICDTCTIIWKELKELVVAHTCRSVSCVTMLAFLILFGILAPWRLGHAWLNDPQVFLVWVLLPIPLVISAAAESFAGERERHTLETLLASPLSDRAILTGKIIAAVLHGWLGSLAVLLLGLITINLVHVTDAFLVYAPLLGIGSLTLGLLASALTACIGVLVSLRVATVRQAQLTLTLLLTLLGFALAAVWAIGLHLLPSDFQLHTALGLPLPNIALLIAALALMLLIADAVLYVAASHSFRRAQLLAD